MRYAPMSTRYWCFGVWGLSLDDVRDTLMMLMLFMMMLCMAVWDIAGLMSVFLLFNLGRHRADGVVCREEAMSGMLPRNLSQDSWS